MRALRPIVGVVGALAVGVAPPESAMGDAAVEEFGGDDAAAARGLAVDVTRLVDDGEAVAALQVMIEVDVAREHVGKRDDDGVRHAGGVGRAEQRSDDLARSQHRAHFLDGDAARRAETVVGALDGQLVARAGHEAHGHEVALVVDRDADGAARPQLVDRPGCGIAAQELHRASVVHSRAREKAADGVASLDALLAPVHAALRGVVHGRQRERALDEPRRDGLEDRVGRDAERGDGGQAHDRQREPLPRMRSCTRVQSTVSTGCGMRLR